MYPSLARSLRFDSFFFRAWQRKHVSKALAKMPKRTAQEKIERYRNKIRKLESDTQKCDKRRSSRIIYSDEENPVEGKSLQLIIIAPYVCA